MKKKTTSPPPAVEKGSRLNGDRLDQKQLLAALSAFKRGDFSVRLPDDWTGLAGKVADTFNEVIGMNQRLARELDRIGQVVGKEGRISQRASLGDVSESWREAIGSVNALIGDLVHPTSEMARVIGAVAKGDLSKTMATEIEGRALQGEFLRTAKTVNTMVDQLGAFASEVTRVAREVGTEGKLGGQAKVKGVAGTWKDLTENVNLMAGNLTAQVRNIATVTTAVANGDLTKKDHRRCQRRVPGAEGHRQRHGGPAALVRVRSDARGARSRFGRNSWRTGARRRCFRHVERSDRLGEFHGAQSDRSGAQHCRGDHRGRDGRPVEENHGRCEGRDSRTEEHDQHDGRSAQLVRLRSDACRPRGRHGRKTRRPGGCEGRGRHVEGFDRLGQLDGRQPDGPGAKHRGSHDRGRQRRFVEKDHGRCARRNSRS